MGDVSRRTLPRHPEPYEGRHREWRVVQIQSGQDDNGHSSVVVEASCTPNQNVPCRQIGRPALWTRPLARCTKAPKTRTAPGSQTTPAPNPPRGSHYRPRAYRPIPLGAGTVGRAGAAARPTARQVWGGGIDYRVMSRPASHAQAAASVTIVQRSFLSAEPRAAEAES